MDRWFWQAMAIAVLGACAIGCAVAQSLPPASPPAMSPAPPAPPATTLKPGDFDWRPEASPFGDMLLVVSLPHQLLYAYRGGLQIGRSTVSTGRPGYETPTGVFTILQKEVEHRSNLYDDAPMPYMQRLTWDGVALHAGALPGYPASHGCIRLPSAFAKLLYGVTTNETVVIVADYDSFAPDVVAPGDTVSPGLQAVAARAYDQVANPDAAPPAEAPRCAPGITNP